MKDLMRIILISYLTLIRLASSSSDAATIKDEAKPSQYEPCKPQHVHLSFGDTVQDINVVWATTKYCQDCQVKYGIDPWRLSMNSSTMYTHFVISNEQGLQHLYRAKLENLSSLTYHYLPVCEGISSGPHFFKVPRCDMDWSPDFLVFGDLGVQSIVFDSLMEEAQSGKYTAIFHVGDFAYDFIFDKGKKGDRFMELIEPVTTYTPYMTSPGNHEIERDTFSHYRHRFAMPGSDWPIPVDQMWYSLDIGPVHFVSYSSEVFFTNNGKFIEKQKQWLLKDLKEANKNRHKTPWIIALGHRPLYCSTHIGDDCSQSFSLVRNGLEDIFYNFSVDIVLQAHEHNYERLWPLYKGNVTKFSYVNANAPIQLISGAPGGREGVDSFPKSSSIPVWSAFRLDDSAMFSYGRLLVVNTTHIWWEQRLASNHTILDSIWILKGEELQDLITSTYSSNVPLTTRSARESISSSKDLSKYSHILAVGIVGLCLMVVIVLFVVRIAVKMKRKKEFRQTWQSTDYNDDDDELDEREDVKDVTFLL